MAHTGSMHPGQAAGALQPEAIIVLSVRAAVVHSTHAADVRTPVLCLASLLNLQQRQLHPQEAVVYNYLCALQYSRAVWRGRPLHGVCLFSAMGHQQAKYP